MISKRNTKPPAGSTPDRGHPLMQGLIGWWPMLEGTGDISRDLSGYGSHGTLKNMDPATAWVAGNPRFGGKALYFDGTDDYFTTGQRAALDPPSAVSVSTWIKRNGAQSTWGAILWNGPANNDPWGAYGFQFWSSADNNINWKITTGTTDTGLATGTIINDLTWYHLVGTYDGATMSLYVNGVLVNSTGKTGAIGDYGDPGFQLGVNNTTLFTGSLDDVRVYNRALTKGEVMQLYVNPWQMFSTGRRSLNTAGAPPASNTRRYGLPMLGVS